MKPTPSIMSLHLRYRLWIAELNFDINILRIFDDYIHELSNKNNETEVKSGIDRFVKQFVETRKEIDKLRHEMHLLKMKLAAYAREEKYPDEKTYKEDLHTELEMRYLDFRKQFDTIKNEFSDFEGKWLS